MFMNSVVIHMDVDNFWLFAPRGSSFEEKQI